MLSYFFLFLVLLQCLLLVIFLLLLIGIPVLVGYLQKESGPVIGMRMRFIVKIVFFILSDTAYNTSFTRVTGLK